MTEVTYSISASKVEDINNILERIINPKVEYDTDKLMMAESVIELSKKYAAEIKNILRKCCPVEQKTQKGS